MNKNNEQIAMSEYEIEFQDINDNKHSFKWQDFPLQYLGIDQRPHSNNGLQYIVNGRYIFIPWHQIKISSFKETILWDNGG